jgi:hypothetical protein
MKMICNTTKENESFFKLQIGINHIDISTDFYTGCRIRIDLIRIRIQGFDDRRLKKKNLYFFFSTITIYLSLVLHKGITRYRKRLHFLNLFLWVIFALLDPDLDPATQVNAVPCGSGSDILLL